MNAAMVAFNWLAGGTLAILLVWLYPDHSGFGITRWILLYAVAIAAPWWWYRKACRYYREHGIAETRELHHIAFRPIIAAFLTLLMALPLIFGSR